MLWRRKGLHQRGRDVFTNFLRDGNEPANKEGKNGKPAGSPFAKRGGGAVPDGGFGGVDQKKKATSSVGRRAKKGAGGRGVKVGEVKRKIFQGGEDMLSKAQKQEGKTSGERGLPVHPLNRTAAKIGG